MPEKEKSTETPEQKVGKRKLLLILLGAAAGLLLLILGSSGLFSDKSSTGIATAGPTPEEQMETYRLQLEERIKILCESVDGVSQVKVAVSLSSGFTSVYATETKNGDENFVIIGSGSSASALFISCEPPEIDGIGVVCRGGGNATVKSELLSLLSAAFHIPSNRIYITEASR